LFCTRHRKQAVKTFGYPSDRRAMGAEKKKKKREEKETIQRRGAMLPTS